MGTLYSVHIFLYVLIIGMIGIMCIMGEMGIMGIISIIVTNEYTAYIIVCQTGTLMLFCQYASLSAILNLPILICRTFPMLVISAEHSMQS